MTRLTHVLCIFKLEAFFVIHWPSTSSIPGTLVKFHVQGVQQIDQLPISQLQFVTDYFQKRDITQKLTLYG
jgi:hypothetical protein